MHPKTPDHGPGGLVLKIIRLLAPVSGESRLTEARWNMVEKKFKSHQSIAEMVCVAGLITGIIVPGMIWPPMQAWDIGIGFAMMCCLPLVYISIVCVKKGFRESWAEVADFSTMKYSISWNIQLGIYLAFGFAGLVSALARYIYPCPIN